MKFNQFSVGPIPRIGASNFPNNTNRIQRIQHASLSNDTVLGNETANKATRLATRRLTAYVYIRTSLQIT